MSRIFEEPPAIVRKDTRRSEEVKKKLKDFEDRVTKDTFELADLLSEARRNDYHHDWGFEKFGDWLKETKFDISEREAYYRMKIVDVSESLGIARAKLVAAGITKLKPIFTLDPATQGDQIVKLVDQAPKHTVQQIKDMVKVAGGDLSDEMGWFNLHAHMHKTDIEEEVKPAFRLAKLNAGETINSEGEASEISDSQALLELCRSYLQDPNNHPEDAEGQGDFEDEVVE